MCTFIRLTKCSPCWIIHITHIHLPHPTCHPTAPFIKIKRYFKIYGVLMLKKIPYKKVKAIKSSSTFSRWCPLTKPSTLWLPIQLCKKIENYLTTYLLWLQFPIKWLHKSASTFACSEKAPSWFIWILGYTMSNWCHR
jgi:hypothetical protein